MPSSFTYILNIIGADASLAVSNAGVFRFLPAFNDTTEWHNAGGREE
jgi:hypothetical protein